MSLFTKKVEYAFKLKGFVVNNNNKYSCKQQFWTNRHFGTFESEMFVLLILNQGFH